MTERATSVSNLVLAVILGLPLASWLFWSGDPVDVALAYLYLLTVHAWGDYGDA